MKKTVFILGWLLAVIPMNALETSPVKTKSLVSPFYVSFDLASFLPAYTAGLKFNYVFNSLWTFGGGLNAFWTLGSSLNTEIFAKITPLNFKHYEAGLSLGLVGGIANEGSFGKTPQRIWGTGVHLRVEPLVIKTGDLALSFLTAGLLVISDFSTFDLNGGNLRENSGLAFSLYVFGIGFRYYLDGCHDK